VRCPNCGHNEDRVVDSRSTKEGAAIRRRRECVSCGHRFTTYEYVERTSALVVKKDGRHQNYDRDRLLAGVLQACHKRPVTREEIDALADRVESRIFAPAREEIPSSEIGIAVMEELEKLDDVAYLRFASVYRSFHNVSEFMDELRSLLERDAGRNTGEDA
jgi:transcriptional repressor NrdR